MQPINVVHEQVYDTAGHPVTGKRTEVQPRIVARKAHVARVRSGFVDPIREALAEAQPGAVEVLRHGRAADAEDGNGLPEQVAPPAG